MALRRRKLGDDGGTVDPGQGLQHEPCHRHQRPGVPGAYAGIGLAVAHEVERHPHRRVPLRSEDLRRRIAHLHALRCVKYGNSAVGGGGCALQRGIDRVLVPDQHQIDIGGLGESLERRGNHDVRSVVSAHCIEGDGVACAHPDAPSVAPALDDLPPSIVSVRAHLVAKMGLAGRRLGRRGRGAQRIVSPAHSAPGSRFPVLLDRHWNSPVDRPPASGSDTGRGLELVQSVRLLPAMIRPQRAQGRERTGTR